MINHEKNVEVVDVTGAEIENVKKQILIGPKEGFEGYMRMFILAENGHTPYHKHDWYHLNYVVEGEGVVTLDGVEHKINPGSVAYVPGNIMHNFKNTGKDDLRFLCIVPPTGESY